MLVVDHADLLRQRAATLERVFRHVGVEPTYQDERFEVRIHQSQDDRQFSSVAERLRTSTAYRRLTQHVRPDVRRRLLKPVREAMSREVPRTTATPEHRAVLCERLAPQADRLRGMTGLAFASWQV